MGHQLPPAGAPGEGRRGVRAHAGRDLHGEQLGLGHVHALPSVDSIEPAVGVRVSPNLVDPALESRYGTRYPRGVMAYFRVAPMKMTPE